MSYDVMNQNSGRAHLDNSLIPCGDDWGHLGIQQVAGLVCSVHTNLTGLMPYGMARRWGSAGLFSLPGVSGTFHVVSPSGQSKTY